MSSTVTATYREMQVGGPGAALQLVEHETREPGPGSVRLIVEAVGICLGVTGLEAMQARGAEFHLGPEVMKGVSAPMPILHGESDVLIPLAEAHEIFGDIPYRDKTLRIYPRGTPGCTHCQLDAIGTAQRAICDWLDDKMGPRPA